MEARSNDLYTLNRETFQHCPLPIGPLVSWTRLVKYEKIILPRILHVVRERGLMQDEKFGFRPKITTSLQLARHVVRITRNFDE